MSRAPSTPIPSRPCSRAAATPKARCWPARSNGTASTACCSMDTKRWFSDEWSHRRGHRYEEGLEITDNRSDGLARRREMGCAGLGAGDRARAGHGRRADAGLDETRGAAAGRGTRARRGRPPPAAAAGGPWRGELWFRGEDSGHAQTVHEIRLDCDRDVLLLRVTQQGHQPGIACHTGRHSCFFSRLGDGAWQAVDAVLKDPRAIYG